MAAGLHFLLVPLVAQGHIISTMDLARLLAHEMRITTCQRCSQLCRGRGHQAHEARRRARRDAFRGTTLRLTEGLENMDMLVERDHHKAFFRAVWRMDAPRSTSGRCPAARTASSLTRATRGRRRCAPATRDPVTDAPLPVRAPEREHDVLHLSACSFGWWLIVTPDFPKKTKCKSICMPGSSCMHIVT
jgi:hypothetical protein